MSYIKKIQSKVMGLKNLSKGDMPKKITCKKNQRMQRIYISPVN